MGELVQKCRRGRYAKEEKKKKIKTEKGTRVRRKHRNKNGGEMQGRRNSVMDEERKEYKENKRRGWCRKTPGYKFIWYVGLFSF